MNQITKTTGIISGGVHRKGAAEQSRGRITGVDGYYLENCAIRNTSKNGLAYYCKPIKASSSCCKVNQEIKVKKLKGKSYKIVFIGFKAYEKIFDPAAQIACIYEENNKNNFC